MEPREAPRFSPGLDSDRAKEALSPGPMASVLRMACLPLPLVAVAPSAMASTENEPDASQPKVRSEGVLALEKTHSRLSRQKYPISSPTLSSNSKRCLKDVM